LWYNSHFADLITRRISFEGKNAWRLTHTSSWHDAKSSRETVSFLVYI